MAEFKLDFFLFWLESLARVAVLFLFWMKIWSSPSGEEISTMERPLFMSLLLHCSIIFLPMRSPDKITQMIEIPVITGSISSTLCRPVNPILMNLSRILCQQMRMLILVLVLLFISDLFLAKHFQLPPPHLSKLLNPLFIISLLTGLLIHNLLYLGIGLFSFWIGEVWSILYALTIVASFMSGQLCPLGMLPDLDFYSQLLPFRYFAYSAASIYSGHGHIDEWFKQLIMLVLISIAIALLYKKAIRKFEAAGG
ncbi:MAG: ABC-2 family transporter protein [Planctomycetes bacterium]|nr:ABC-2 family transporter protein [Planctomycetota bacterium]